MSDWTDDFVMQAILSYPKLKYVILQAHDLGDMDSLLNLLLSNEEEIIWC